MSKTFAGKGRKRPQLNIPIQHLNLDTDNPRLAKEAKGSTPFDIIKTLYDEFDIEELAFSMAENGYFDEEPIIVVPKKLPKSLKLDANIEEQQKQLQELIEKGEIEFIVVEGNRRTATLKLLTDEKLQKRVGVGADFPKPTKAILEDLQIIPAICYLNRDHISAYLGVRHIAGLLKWEAYAKAVFLATRIEDGVKNGKSIANSIKEVQRQTADRSDTIKKQYLCYKVLKEAEDSLDFDVDNIKNRFSLMTLCLNSGSIREFIGCPSYKEADFSKKIIPTKMHENLDRLLTWIFGNDTKTAIITDSRKISSRLAPVLADDDSREYFIETENLEDAYERSGGEKKFLTKKITDATRNLRNALTIGYKYKTTDTIALVDDCINAANELKKMLQS